ncbi:hypothetical protein KEU06_22875, partial [Pseudaminobacter sp. 19-2017]
TLSERLHLPFPATELEAATARGKPPHLRDRTGFSHYLLHRFITFKVCQFVLITVQIYSHYLRT